MTIADRILKVTKLGRERLFRDLSNTEGTAPIRRVGNPPTVLAIHGFTGVPSEVQMVCDVATELGLASVAPLLAGHGKDAKALAQTAYSDWLQSARNAFDEARKSGPVVLVGLSMGSLVATELALGAPGDVAGLALLSNAFWLKGPHPALSLRIAELLRSPDFYVDKKGSNLRDPLGRAEHVSLDAQPIRSAISLLAAGRRLRGELFRIHRPTLFLHGSHDTVCPVENSWKAAELVGTPDTRVVVLARSGHIITRDFDRAQVAEELRCFFQKTCARIDWSLWPQSSGK